MDTIDSKYVIVEIQENGIIRDEFSRMIGRLIDEVPYINATEGADRLAQLQRDGLAGYNLARAIEPYSKAEWCNAIDCNDHNIHGRLAALLFQWKESSESRNV